MAYEPRRWALGLLGAGVCWVLGTSGEIGEVEADLAARAKAALGAAMLDKLHISVSGRDVTISGAAFTREGVDGAIRAVADVEGVRRVDARGVEPIAEAKPYVWSATRDGASLTLAGGVPDPAARAAINAAAGRVPGVTVVDEMEYRRGDTAALAAGSAFALAELAGLSKGAATLSDGALTLSGAAADPKAYEQTLSALKAPPAGVTVATADLAPAVAKPFVFAAEASRGAVALTGYAPSFAARDAIVAAATAAFPRVHIDNSIAIADGAPRGDFAASAKFALSALSGLEAGKAEISDTRLAISGKARAPGDVEALASTLASPPAGFSVAKSDIAPAIANPFALFVSHGENAVTLSGDAPSADARAAIAAAAAKAFPGVKIENDLLVAAGGPRGDFVAAANFALAAAAGVEHGKAIVAGDRISVSGQARAPGDIEALAAPPAGFSLVRSGIAPPAALPFAFFASASDGVVSLSGDAPSDEARGAIAAQAAKLFPGLKIENGVVVAGGAPAGDFVGAAKFALSAISGLDGGKATVAGGRVALVGRARAPGDIEALAATALPAGFALGKLDIAPTTANPFALFASHASGAVSLRGDAPSAEARDAIAAQAAKLFPGQKIENGLEIAGGAPSGDFVGAAKFALAAISGLDGGKATVAGTTISLAGAARAPGDLEALAAAAPPAGFALGKLDVAPATAIPFALFASRSGGALSLSGDAPSAAARDAIAAQAAKLFPGQKIENGVVVAGGAPAGDFVGAAKFALSSISGLDGGKATIAGASVKLAGRARAPGDVEAITAAAAGLPAGFGLAKSEIAPAIANPFAFFASRSDGAVSLSGDAPSAEARDVLAAEAAKLFPGEKIENAVVVAGGAPAGDFVGAAKFALRSVSGLDGGKAALAGTALSIAGRARAPGDLEALAAASGLPAGFSWAKADIAPAAANPFALFASHSEGAVSLSGDAPSAEARDAIAAEASKRFPGQKIDNGLVIAGGAPAGDFVGAAKFALSAISGLDGGKATVAGTTISLAGAARAPGDLEALAAAAAPAGFALGKLDVAPATAIPFAFFASHSGGAVSLTGDAPSAAARDAIAAQAAKLFPGQKIENGLVIASGAPVGDFVGAAKFALSSISGLDGGKATIAGASVSLAGRARAPGDLEAIAAAAAGLPPGFALAKPEIAPAIANPFTFFASRDADTIALTGDVPSAAARDSIVAQWAKAFPGDKIVDALVVAGGAPAGDFVDAALIGLAMISDLDDGKATLAGTKLSVSGRARAPGGVEAILAGAPEMPAGFALANVDVAPAPANPFALFVTRSGDGVLLAGDVPSFAARDAIAAEAARLFPDVKIGSALVVAGGAPAGDFTGAARFALGAVANLAEGKATLTGAKLAIGGLAKAPGAIEALDKAAPNLPAGFAIAALDVAPAVADPFALAVAKTADGLKITGCVPDAATRAAIDAAAAEVADGKPVVDETVLARGSLDGVDFLGGVKYALGQLGELVSGEARLSGDTFSINGSAAHASEAQQIEDSLEALPMGWRLGPSEILAPDPDKSGAAEPAGRADARRLAGLRE